MVAALIGYQIQAEFLFSSVETSPVWWLIAGLLAGSLRDSRGKELETIANEKRAAGSRRLSDATAIVFFWLGVTAGAAFLLWGGRLIYADYHFKQGLPARETGAPDEIRELETAVGANPSMRVYRLALVHAYLANGKRADDRVMVDRSITVHQTAIDERGDDEFYYSLGDAQAFYGLRWDKDRLATALEAYSRAAELRPYFPYTYWEIGYIYAQTGAFSRAIPFYRRSLELDPDNANAWSDLGIAYERTGKTDRAKESYRPALEGQPRLQPAIDGLNRLR